MYLRNRRGFVYEADKGAGSDPAATVDPAKGTTTAAAPSAETKNTDTTQQAEPMIPKSRFDEINDELKKIKAAQAKAETDAAAAAEKQAEAEKQWEKLANDRKVKIDELQAKADLADRLTALMQEQFDTEIKDWPDVLKRLAPGADATIDQKLAWLQTARETAKELTAEPPPAGVGRRPTPGNPAGDGKRDETARAAQSSWTSRIV